MAKLVRNLAFKLNSPVTFRININKVLKSSKTTSKVNKTTEEVAVPKTSRVPKALQGYTKVGSKQLAVVIIENGIFKARLTTSPVEETQEFKVVDFTPRSLELKGKSCVFYKNKDKYNHNVCYMRDATTSKHNPGTTDQYDVFKENILISGHLYRKDGVLYFDYEKLMAFKANGTRLDELMIDSNQ